MMDVSVGSLVNQGAEAKLYQTELYGSTYKWPCIVKERFKKRYRHPELDQTLSTHRMRAEVRQLLRCRELGIDVPPVLLVDVATRRIWLGWVGPDASTLHEWFGHLFATRTDQTVNGDVRSMCSSLGHLIAKLHANHIIHGDLTMSNILVRKHCKSPGKDTFSLVPIDFGLSSTIFGGQSLRLLEEKAVDFYVFERALSCAIDHDALDNCEADINNPELLINLIVKSYEECYIREATKRESVSSGVKSRKKDPKTVAANEISDILVRLDEVRLRGRKRVMVG